MSCHHPFLLCIRNTVVLAFLFTVSAFLVLLYAFGTLGPNDSFLGSPLPLMHYCIPNGRAGIIRDAVQDVAALSLLLTPPILFARHCLRSSPTIRRLALIPIFGIMMTSISEGISLHSLYPLTHTYCAQPFSDAISTPPPPIVTSWRWASQVFGVITLVSIPWLIFACAAIPFFDTFRHSPRRHHHS